MAGFAVDGCEVFVNVLTMTGSRVLVVARNGTVLREWSVCGRVLPSIAIQGADVLLSGRDHVMCFRRDGSLARRWSPLPGDIHSLAVMHDRVAVAAQKSHAVVSVYARNGLQLFALQLSDLENGWMPSQMAFSAEELFVVGSDDLKGYAANDGTFLRVISVDPLFHHQPRITVSRSGILGVATTGWKGLSGNALAISTLTPDGKTRSKWSRVGACQDVAFSESDLLVLFSKNYFGHRLQILRPTQFEGCEVVVTLE